MVRPAWNTSAARRTLGLSWLAATFSEGAGQAAIVSCEAEATGLTCSRNSTIVDNATEIVEIRLQMDPASLELTQISVPGYRVVIEISENGGGLFNQMGDSMGVSSIILGNLAAMVLLLVICALIGAVFRHQNMGKIEEMQGMMTHGMEMAGLPVHGDYSSDDEDALQLSEAGDVLTLDKKALAANAAVTWRDNAKGKKGGKRKKRNPVFSTLAGLAAQVVADPAAQDMVQHAHRRTLNPMDQNSKVLNPMRGSSSAASDLVSTLGEELLSGGSEIAHSAADAAHKVIDDVTHRATQNPMVEGIDAPEGKKKGKK